MTESLGHDHARIACGMGRARDGTLAGDSDLGLHFIHYAYFFGILFTGLLPAYFDIRAD